MAFRVDAIYDLASGEQPLVWDDEAVIEGYFSADQGRILVSDVTAEIISWTTAEIRFRPKQGGTLEDGSYPIHVDNIDIPVTVTVQALASVSQSASLVITQDHETLVAASLGAVAQVQGVAIEQVVNDVEYLHDFVGDDIGSWTFARASAASAPDRNGTLRFYDADEPAWYKNKGLLIEPTATNYIAKTDISQWSGFTGGSASLYGMMDGLQSYSVDGNAQSSRVSSGSLFTPTGENYALSFLTERGGISPDSAMDVSFGLWDITNTAWYAASSKSDSRGSATFGTQDDLIRVSDVGYSHPSKIEIQYTAISGAGAVLYMYANDYLLVAEKSHIVSSMQIEEGTHSTSFIPTAGTAVTRALATCNAPMSALGELPAEGVTNNFCGQFEFRLGLDFVDGTLYNNSPYYAEIYGDANNYIQFRTNSATQLRMLFAKNGVTANRTVILPADQEGDLIDIKFKFSSTEGVKLWINGTASAFLVNTGDFTTALDTVYLGNAQSGTRPGPIAVGRFRLRTAAITDAEIEAWDSCYKEYLHDFRHGDLGPWTYTRASDATVVDRKGHIRRLGVDDPMFEGGGLRMEDSRTTVTSYSGGFDSGYDKADNIIAFPVDHPAPDGSNDSYVAGVDLLPSAGYSYLRKVRFGNKDATYNAAVTIFFKFSRGQRYIGLRFGEAGNLRMAIDTLKIEPVNTSWGTVEIVPMADGWYRATAIVENQHVGETSQGINVIDFTDSAGNDYVALPDGAQTVIWGFDAKMENAPSSFIENLTGSDVTRALASCVSPFSELPGLPAAGITAAEGFAGQVIVTVPAPVSSWVGNKRVFRVGESNVADTTGVDFMCRNTTSGFALEGRTGGTRDFIAYFNIADTTTPNLVFDIRFRIQNDNYYWTINGETRSSESVAPMAGTGAFQHAGLGIGLAGQNSGNNIIAHRSRLVGYPASDAEIEAWPGLDDEYIHSFDRRDLGGFTHTRASDATVVDVYGNVVTLGTDETAWWKGQGVQLEDSRTNQFPDSTLLGEWSWNGIGRVPGGGDVGTRGVATELITPNTSDINHMAYDVSSIEAGVTYVQTHVIKAAGYDWIQVSGNAGFNAADYQNINVATGELGASNGTSMTTTTEMVANGFCKVMVQNTATHTDANGRMRLSFLNADIDSYQPAFVGDGVSAFNHDWSQLEAGEFPTSYIATSGTPYTRAHVPFYANFSDIDLPAGVRNNLCVHIVFRMTMDVEAIPSGARIARCASNRTSNTNTFIVYKSGTNLLYGFCYLAGTPIHTNSFAVNWKAGDLVDIRFRKDSVKGMTVWVDGVQVIETLNGLDADFSEDMDVVTIASRYATDNNGYFPMILHHLRVVPETRSNADIEAWPTWVEPEAPPAIPVIHFLGASDQQSQGEVQDGAVVSVPQITWHEQNFATDGIGNWPHTRASSATYEDAAGVVQTVANDVAAIGPKGLQVEMSSTNIVNNSADWNTNWSYTGTPVLWSGAVDPAGTNKACRMSIHTGSYFWQMHTAVGSTNSDPVALSFWIKRISDDTTGNLYIYHNISPNGEWTINAADIPTEWTRITRAFPALIVGQEFETDNGLNVAATFSSTDATDVNPLIVEIAFVQMELNNSHFATSYIETTDATPVTRAATDVQALFTDLGAPLEQAGSVNGISGQIIAESTLGHEGIGGGAQGIGAVGGATSSNQGKIEGYHVRSGNGNVTMREYNAFSAGSVSHTYLNAKVCAGWIFDYRFLKSSTEGLVFWLNGVKQSVPDKTADYAQIIERATLGATDNGGSPFAGWISQVRLSTDDTFTTADVEAWGSAPPTEHELTIGSSIGSYGYVNGSYGAITPNPEPWDILRGNTGLRKFEMSSPVVNDGTHRFCTMNDATIDLTYAGGYWSDTTEVGGRFADKMVPFDGQVVAMQVGPIEDV